MYHNFSYRQPLDRLRDAGPDGQVELQGLCKGTYRLKAEAPGKAWVERKAIVTPDLDPVESSFVLDRGRDLRPGPRRGRPARREGDRHADGTSSHTNTARSDTSPALGSTR